ncbi:hypothetical protein DFH28DRAFT_953432 [Melampsora americana]|nr:hypothetical protein DFH28DRAFT_953432 [Melampsora americana]
MDTKLPFGFTTHVGSTGKTVYNCALCGKRAMLEFERHVKSEKHKQNVILRDKILARRAERMKSLDPLASQPQGTPTSCSLQLPGPSLSQSQGEPSINQISTGSERAGGEVLSNIVATIASEFGLTPTQTAQINKCFQQPSDQRCEIAQMCFLTSLVAQNPVSKAVTQVTIPTGQESKTLHNPKIEWKGEDNVRQFMRDTIRDCLMKPVIEAYSTANSILFDNNVIIDSLGNLAMEDVVMKSQGHVKDSDLPEGFRSGDVAAKCAVRKVLKEIAKSEKSKFQIELLHNIEDPELDSKVPTLKDLYFWLSNPWRGPKTTTNDDLWNNTKIADKSRIALLRLEGTIFHLHAEDSTQPRIRKERFYQSMWDPVDERLAWVRKCSNEDQKAFYRWIKQYDAKLFTGSLTFEQIKQANHICIITPEELTQWVNAGEPALNQEV